MIFRVSPQRASITELRTGCSRFRQSTALIGATLLFCLSSIGAEAQTLYYNFGQNGGSPTPQTGGVWSTNNADDNWVREVGGAYSTNNTNFDNGDDVHFLSTAASAITVEVDGTLSAGSITINDGTFELVDRGGPFGSVNGDSLAVMTGSALETDVDLNIAGATIVSGALTLGGGTTLTANSTVAVNGSLSLDGKIVGDVTLNNAASLAFGGASSIDGTLTFNGTTFVGGGHVGALTINAGSTVTFAGATAKVDGQVANRGNVTIGQGTFNGALNNSGTVTLTDDVDFGNTAAPPKNIFNAAGATIQASGGDRRLTSTGTFGNNGTLNGGGNSLTVEAPTITLWSTSALLGDVTLAGYITNHSDLDMVHVPVLTDTFVNGVAGRATVTTDVDGNGQDFSNGNVLWIKDGDLTGLKSLTNTGTVTVDVGRTLAAGTISHTAGTLTSAGTLTGTITSRATADISGAVIGSYRVTGGTTTISGNLDLGASIDGGQITVDTAGQLTVADNAVVTVARLTNDGTTDLGATGAVITGDVVNSGQLSGNATINGNLTFRGDSATSYTGTGLTVGGALTNDLDDPALLSGYAGITFAELRNAGTLTIDQTVSGPVTNLAGASLTVGAAIDGRLLSYGDTLLNQNVDGQLYVAGGVTSVGANLAGGAVQVGGVAAPELTIGSGGALQVNGGNLVSTGEVRAVGRLLLGRSYSLTAPQLTIAGDNGSVIRGNVIGLMAVQSAGTVELDGATVTGRLTNNGTLNGADIVGRPVQLQGGLVNSGRAILTSTSQPAIISGLLRNGSAGYAEINANVIAGGGLAGDVINLGELRLTGTVAGSLQNDGTANVGATITGNAVNSGTLNITGNSEVTDLINSGTVNVTSGRRLDLTSGALTNTAGAALNVAGQVGTPAGSGMLALRNDQGGTVTVAGSGTVAGHLDNAGTARVAGTVTGDVVTSGTGQTELQGSAQIDGTLTNRGTTTVAIGAEANVDGGTLNQLGTIEVVGTLNSDLVNSQNGTVEIVGGTVRGDVQNDAGAAIISSGTIIGDVSNQGTYTVDLFSRVEGNFINDGTLTQSGNNSRIQVTDTFVNNGTISAGNFANAEITISAATYENNSLTEGSIVVDADIGNSDMMIFRGESRLLGNLTNFDNGIVRVWGNVTGDGGNIITNRGIFDVSQGGALVNVDRIANHDQFVVAAGSRVQANDIVIAAGTLTNDGRIEADITNLANGAMTSAGTIVGDVLNQGEARLQGRLNGGLATAATGSTTISGNMAVSGPVSNAGRMEIEAGGQLNLAQPLVNQTGGRLTALGTIVGDVLNQGQASLQGRLNGGLATAATGSTTISGNMAVSGPVSNAGRMEIEAGGQLNLAQPLVNQTGGRLTALGAIDGNLLNNGQAEITGGLTGNLTNAGDALLSGRITGTVLNDGANASTVIRIRGDSLRAGAVSNQSGRLIVGGDQTLSVDGQFRNIGDGVVVVAGTVALDAGQTLLNASSGELSMMAGSTLNGGLRNEAEARLAGTIDGSVLNRGSATGSGVITDDLVNQGGFFQTGGDLVVEGQVINQRAPVNGTTVRARAQQQGPGDPAALLVSADTTLTARAGLTNDRLSAVQVDGALNADVINRGRFDLNNRLQGALDNYGSAELEGEITGDLTLRKGGSIAMTGDLTVGGIFDAFDDFAIGRDETLTTGLYRNRVDRQLTVNGRLLGQVRNRGTITAGPGAEIGSLLNDGAVFVDSALNIDGALANNGRISLLDGTADDVLRVNGNVSGDGVYALDLNISANDNAGASDRVVVRGGSVTGSVFLDFDSGDLGAPSNKSRRILVFDVDGSQGGANDFSFNAAGLPTASERIIYAVEQDAGSGDLYVTDTINPALGALAGNLALTQSLIGAVVNRPSSPFVPGLATDAGDQKCGFGAWSRAVAGHASATGRSSSDTLTIASEIEANYRGLQFGGDLACFEGSVSGWNVAFGALGGVNDGSTTQPVYVNDPTNPSKLTDVLGSINHVDFRQLYAGLYATASRDRLSLDLQIRRERTNFTIDNNPVGSGSPGLSLDDSEFDSNATTISGSVSYAYPLPRDGWTFLPTAGFAFTNLSVDKIYFSNKDTDDTLQIEDSKNRVGFIGGTLSKTFINPKRNSAIYAFGTATFYKDFAGDTKSVYTMVAKDGSVLRTDDLSSTNLGTYGELSLGANYLKVLDSGSAHAPRQFNASLRVDGRTGDVLDSYGVTAQIRLQF